MVRLEDDQFIKSKYIVLTEHVSEAKLDFLINQAISKLNASVKETLKILHNKAQNKNPDYKYSEQDIDEINSLIQYINSNKNQDILRSCIQLIKGIKTKILAIDKNLPKHKRFHFNFNANLNTFFDAMLINNPYRNLHEVLNYYKSAHSKYNKSEFTEALLECQTSLRYLLEDIPHWVRNLQLWDLGKQSKQYLGSFDDFVLYIDDLLYNRLLSMYEDDIEDGSAPIRVQVERWIQDQSDTKYDVISSVGAYTIVHPLDKLSYLKLGYGTHWCTSLPDMGSGTLRTRQININVPIEDIKKQIVEQTANYPNAIIVLKDNKPFIQLDKESDQIMDVNDKSLGSFTFETDSDLMDPLLGSLIPTLRQVGHALIPKINGLQNINPGNIDPDDEYEFVNPITNYMITSSAFKLAIFKAALNLNTTKAYVYITSNSEIFKDPNLASVLRAINIVPVDMTKITVARILETIKNNPNLFNQYNKVYSNHQYIGL